MRAPLRESGTEIGGGPQTPIRREELAGICIKSRTGLLRRRNCTARVGIRNTLWIGAIGIESVEFRISYIKQRSEWYETFFRIKSDI